MHESDQSDGLLLAEFATSGSHSAFAQIVERHGSMVHAVARRVVGDHHDAEDVAQAAFLALARKAASKQQVASVGAWLHHVAWCLALNAGRNKRRREGHEAAAMREREQSVPAEVDRQAFQAELDAAINQLAERYRRPLVLFHLEGQSLQQTAERLGLNLHTVGNQLARARELLRQKLVRRGVTVSSVGVLMTLLSAESGAAALPATFVSATVKAASLAATGKLAAAVATGAVSANVATLTKGALNMLFWSSVKTAAAVTVASVVVTGGGVLVAQEVAVQRKAAEQPAAAVAGVSKTMEEELRRAQGLLTTGNATKKQAGTMADEALKLKAMESARNDFKQAAEVFENAAKDNPSHKLAPKATVLAGQCLIRAEDWDSAIRVFTAFSDNKTADVELRSEGLYWLGDCFTNKGDNQNAARVFKKLTFDYPESKWAKYARGRLSEEKFQDLHAADATAKPATATVQTPAPAAKAEPLFSSRAWRNDEASRDLERAGIRVFHVGGWGYPEAVDWATPAELRRRPMPAADYVNAWAASRKREVWWLSDVKVNVSSGSLSVNPKTGVSELEGDVKIEIPGAGAPITGRKAEYHKEKNTLVVDGVSIPLPKRNVAIIGTKAELETLKQRAGGESASVEAILAKLAPNDGRPPVGSERATWDPEQDQATLQKTFRDVQGEAAKWDAAMALCAAGGDEGLAYLKAELAKDRAVPDAPQGHNALEAFGAHGGPEALAVLKTYLSNQQASMQWRAGAGLALGRNASEAALAILRQALASDDADTAFGAACSLELVGGKPGLELAALGLAQTDPKVRRSAAFGAYRAHGERALPLLEKALGDADAGVRQMAATGLGNIGGDKAGDLIRRQLAHEKDPDVLRALQAAQKRLEER